MSLIGSCVNRCVITYILMVTKNDDTTIDRVSRTPSLLDLVPKRRRALTGPIEKASSLGATMSTDVNAPGTQETTSTRTWMLRALKSPHP